MHLAPAGEICSSGVRPEWEICVKKATEIANGGQDRAVIAVEEYDVFALGVTRAIMSGDFRTQIRLTQNFYL